MTCKKPDKDVPGLICGHPLPCPYHTIEIEADSLKTSKPSNKAITIKQYLKLKKIGKILRRIK